jgi:hypothetical protein
MIYNNETIPLFYFKIEVFSRKVIIKTVADNNTIVPLGAKL